MVGLNRTNAIINKHSKNTLRQNQQQSINNNNIKIAVEGINQFRKQEILTM